MMASNKRPSITVLKQLEPIEGVGVAPLLQTEIDRLRAENLKLRDRMQVVEGKAIQAVQGQKGLNQELEQTRTALEKSQNQLQGPTDEDITALSDQLKSVKTQLARDLEISQDDQKKLQEELTGAHKRLLEVKEQLEMTEQELERKFSQTVAYKNLKGMLSKKNQQIKQLRSALTKYEPADKTTFDED